MMMLATTRARKGWITLRYKSTQTMCVFVHSVAAKHLDGHRPWRHIFSSDDGKSFTPQCSLTLTSIHEKTFCVSKKET